MSDKASPGKGICKKCGKVAFRNLFGRCPACAAPAMSPKMASPWMERVPTENGWYWITSAKKSGKPLLAHVVGGRIKVEGISGSMSLSAFGREGRRFAKAAVADCPPSPEEEYREAAAESAGIINECRAILHDWRQKQGHDACWYYPDLFQALMEILLPDFAEERPARPSFVDFCEGCCKFQRDLYPELFVASDARAVESPLLKTAVTATEHFALSHLVQLLEFCKDLMQQLYSRGIWEKCPMLADSYRNLRTTLTLAKAELQKVKTHAQETPDLEQSQENPDCGGPQVASAGQ